MGRLTRGSSGWRCTEDNRRVGPASIGGRGGVDSSSSAKQPGRPFRSGAAALPSVGAPNSGGNSLDPKAKRPVGRVVDDETPRSPLPLASSGAADTTETRSGNLKGKTTPLGAWIT
jgi:hypothetical protein